MSDQPPENTRGKTPRSKNDRDTDLSRPAEPSSSPTNTPSNNPSTQSLAGRIQSSATNLARSTFQPPGSGAEVSRTLASTTNGKAAGPSSLPPSSTQYYSASQDVIGVPSSSTRQTRPGSSAAAESFRSNAVDGTSAETQGGFTLPPLTEEEFQQQQQHLFDDGGISLGDRDGDGGSRDPLGTLQSETGNWKGKQRTYDPVQRRFDTAWERGQPTSFQGIDGSSGQAQINSTDGAGVISLLSDPAFDAGFSTTTDTGDAEPELETDLAFSEPPPLTPAEMEMLDSFRRQMTPPPPHSTQSQHLTSFSLVPDIDTFLQQHDPSAAAETTSTSLRDNVLSHLPGATDWIGVQDRYHDEVWGFLRPALEAAKTEMEEKGPGPHNEDEDGPAVRRLKMILKHMGT
ncbi:hypothetical protein N7474_004386 [Penicillium riverlandense]|uniref:uncharacterized protein n=1 Tax=Penicillium riverlandense TaxID=1903569 RepID=UPI0025473DE3|nr:uncharacterized protein N7474_004386 [Penicillium riverlandense]KAJ5818795.1 hypothetical protein N7474_004386 [Penicillium riverlandense]